MEGTIGEIRLFAGNFAPRSWALCQGQLLAISTNTALFSVIGTIYGGDGRTTMGLPDLQGRAAIGAGQGAGLPLYPQGAKAGTDSVTLQVGNLPAHNHSPRLYAELALATTGDPTNRLIAGPPAASPVFADANPDVEVAMHPDSIKSSNVGSNIPVSVQNPVQALHYIICLEGIYPSRN